MQFLLLFIFIIFQHYSNAWPRIPKPDLFFYWLIFRCICTHSFTRLAKLVRLNIWDLPGNLISHKIRKKVQFFYYLLFYQPWCHWRLSENRWARSDQLFVNNRNYSFVLENYGIGLRIIQNCGHLYITENLAGRDRIVLHLPDVRSFLARSNDIGM